MKYMLLIYGNDDVWNSLAPEDFEVLVRETDAHNNALFASGELIGAWGVADQRAARTVRHGDAGTIVSDGPYIETKEYLGSFSIVECESLERATEIAAGMPSARLTSIEIRPLMHEAVDPM